ncbi:MAG: fatty acid desaturase [bacterium]|nr:fatty acid desaturase [bacterium]
MTVIIIFFAAHWFFSLLFQSMFHHRYAAHPMYTMSKRWERAFFILSFLAQGASYLNPRTYAIMHRMHHAYSDDKGDPHTPHRHKTAVQMMLETYRIYIAILHYKFVLPDPKLAENVPTWPAFEKFADGWFPRVLFAGLYFGIYATFAPSLWFFLLIPIHFEMGPVHGAIVNWCGHKYGYVNHRDTNDKSRNSLPIDLVTFGELYQNNHHNAPNNPNFAHRWFELDVVYLVMRLLQKLRVITFNNPLPTR